MTATLPPTDPDAYDTDDINGIDLDHFIEFLAHSNAIEDVWTQVAVQDSIDAYAALQQADDPHSHDTIQRIHPILMDGRMEQGETGQYRDFTVWVGGDRIDARNITDDMEEWFDAVDDIEDRTDALDAHVTFEQIHPFGDGNGRIGRLYYCLHCQQAGVAPEIFRYKDRFTYYTLFDETGGQTLTLGGN